MSQLYGVFIIARALFPLVFVVMLYLLLRRLAAEARATVAPHLAEIDIRAGNIKATLAAGQDTAEAIGEQIEAVADTVDDITDVLAVDLGVLQIPEAVNPFTLAEELASLLGMTITPTLDFATKTLSDTYNILGLGQVKDAIDNLLGVMTNMAAAIGITTVADDVGAISGEVGNMTGALLKLWLRWRQPLRRFLLVSALCLALIYAVWLVLSVVRGLALITGLPDPGPG